MIQTLYEPFRHWSEGGSIFIISDLHFDDANCKSMNKDWITPKEQIQRINKLVKKNDTFICLGDVGKAEYVKQINARRKILLLGNHDRRSDYVGLFNEIYTGPLFIADKILLSHEPVHGLSWCLNIHGHDHNCDEPYMDGCKYLNLAANVCDFTPVNLGKLIKNGILSDINDIHRLTIDRAITRKAERKKAEKELLVENSGDETQLEVYTYSAEFDEMIRGMLVGYSPEQVIKIYKKIGPCKCGAENPKVLETECMGDYDFSITCRNCGRSILRSMYDFDVNKPDDWIDLCIRDWNNGISQEEIEAAKDADWERKRIKEEHFTWKPVRPNNMAGNPIEGYYALLFMRQQDGKVYGCKWTIIFQKEETQPGLTSQYSKVEAYILFMKRYFDLEDVFDYLKSETVGSHPYLNSMGPYDGVNDYGDFVRAYRNLEEAKLGAMERCAWQGLYADTVIKDIFHS